MVTTVVLAIAALVIYAVDKHNIYFTILGVLVVVGGFATAFSSINQDKQKP